MDPQVTFRRAAGRGDFGFRCLDSVQNFARAIEEHLALRRESEPPRGPIEKPDTEARFRAASPASKRRKARPQGRRPRPRSSRGRPLAQTPSFRSLNSPFKKKLHELSGIIAHYPCAVNRHDAHAKQERCDEAAFRDRDAGRLGIGHRRVQQSCRKAAQDVVGTWEWVSVENTASDGAITHPFGPKPGGYLTFDRSGRFFWLITRPNRLKFASGRRDQGTADENKATVQGSLAYAGTYAIEDENR